MPGSGWNCNDGKLHHCQQRVNLSSQQFQIYRKANMILSVVSRQPNYKHENEEKRHE
jgi:hypothetical protein